MLRIVIVDDEVLIREGLARMISKESDNFDIVGTYPDGRQVLDGLPELHFDVVITDIRMPQIDGLELIKRLKASHPHIRSILMSGFVEFNYAREAIRSSAVDYLLKPIDKEQLFELLYRLNVERKQQLEKEAGYRSGLLLSLLHIEEPSTILMTGLTLPQPYFTTFVLKESCQETVCFCADSLRQEKESLFDDIEVHKGLHVLIWYSERKLTSDEMKDIADLIMGEPPEHVQHLGSSCSYNDPSKLRQAYIEAKQACDAGIYSPKTFHYANIQEISKSGTVTTAPFSAFSESLIHDLQILNVSGVMESVHKIFSELRVQQAYSDQILHICHLIEETASKELQEFKAVYKRVITHIRLQENIQSCTSFKEMENLFTSVFSSALNEIRTGRLEMSGTAVETVKRWITANYNQHAELNHLANIVFLTPSYLSKLFKQETGMTLTDYIIEIRIRKAKQLLKNSPDLKVHEIGSEVGYPDPAYFNKLFKRVVGVTPNEYKRISI
ncbi:response regulator [Paenibacillus wynnii]|uniref:AraC family transcriptional regulator n=1 Tax=Paenibacillus wynnii TaxID=268407 RepID=A0A098MB79_9BACL|nr:response regulator [Paenibacillus wynnii]KGE19303.1 hypothetical protein PWYN_08010 [Paenibacillus wynnii]